MSAIWNDGLERVAGSTNLEINGQSVTFGMVVRRDNSLGRGENESEVALEVFGDGVGKSTELSLASLVDRILVVVRLEEVIGLADRDLDGEYVTSAGERLGLKAVVLEPCSDALEALGLGGDQLLDLRKRT